MAKVNRKFKQEQFSEEFVVGGRNPFLNQEVLPNSIQDKTDQKITEEIIKLAKRDSEVSSSVEYLVNAVFSDGFEVIPAVNDESDPEYKKANEIAEFIEKNCIKSPKKPFEKTMREMFRGAFYNGTKVAEIVLRNDKGKLILDRLNIKPNKATAFVVDKFYNVLGLVGAKDSRTSVSTSVVSLSSEEVISLEKFVILTFEHEDNDPRGITQIKAAIDPMCDNRLTRAQRKEWRKICAIPVKVGITHEKAQDIEVRDENGKPVLVDGVAKKITAQKALLNSLIGMQSNSAVAVPYGTEITQLEVKGTGQQFEVSLDSNKQEIRKAILLDALATGSAMKDVRAARDAASRIVDQRIKDGRNEVCNTVRNSLFTLLVAVNFGENYLHLTPECSLGDTERKDWATDLNAASGAGYTFDESQFPELDAQLGAPKRAPKPKNQSTQNDSESQPGNDSHSQNNQDQTGGNQQ